MTCRGPRSNQLTSFRSPLQRQGTDQREKRKTRTRIFKAPVFPHRTDQFITR
uniref:PilS cassette n=1 Tax=Mesocestoides corti TaxID=53468 RepID=A0A5K3EW65_MESCO